MEMLSILLLVIIVLGFLLPFFVLRIRNEIILVNQNLIKIIRILGEQETSGGINYYLEKDHKNRTLKVCRSCGQKNRAQDIKCIGCGNDISMAYDTEQTT